MEVQGILTTKNYMQFTIMDAAFKSNLMEIDGPKLVNPCLHGDEVIYNGSTMTLVKRAVHPRLAGLLDLKSRTTYGVSSRGVPIYLFYPFDKRYPPMRVGCSERDRSVNRIALVDFADFTKSDIFPRGNLDRLLGVAGEMGCEIEALAFTVSPYYKSKGFGPVMYSSEPARREGDDGWMTINIDPEGCKDIDDIISLKPISGGWDCIISIADVDSVIEAGSALDLYAMKTLQTVYDNGRAIKPMLPTELSEGVCSLIPGSPKPVVGLCFKYIETNMPGHRVVDKRFELLHIVNKKSYTYETIYSATDFPVSTLKMLASELSDAEIPIEDSHDWIAELMKFYNLSVAETIKDVGAGIFRGHAGPKMERLLALRAIVEESVAQSLANEAAKYSSGSDVRHYGFNDKLYCHASSPIRRYVDLYNQRLLKAVITGSGTIRDEADEGLIYRLNEVSRAAREFDRVAKFMRCLEGAEGTVEAIVLSCNEDNTQTKIYIPAWKMTFRAGAVGAVGAHVAVSYYFDANKPMWRQRMVFSA
jgi:hypothetical protein